MLMSLFKLAMVCSKRSQKYKSVNRKVLSKISLMMKMRSTAMLKEKWKMTATVWQNIRPP
jgi:hypothetical protein